MRRDRPFSLPAMNPSQPIEFDSDAKARMVAALIVTGLIVAAFVSNFQPPHSASPSPFLTSFVQSAATTSPQPLVTTQSPPFTLENEPVRSLRFPGTRPKLAPGASFPDIGRSVDLFDSRVPPPVIDSLDR